MIDGCIKIYIGAEVNDECECDKKPHRVCSSHSPHGKSSRIVSQSNGKNEYISCNTQHLQAILGALPQFNFTQGPQSLIRFYASLEFGSRSQKWMLRTRMGNAFAWLSELMTLLGPVRTLGKIVISLSPSHLLSTSFSRSLSLSLSLGKLLELGIVCEEVFNECTFGAQQLSLSYTHTRTCMCVCA